MADFSLSFFGKSLMDLTYQDIIDYFIEERGESNNIEFKGFSPVYGNFNNNINGIIRAICGLLNSEGGMVIWGAPMGIDDPVTREKKFVGALSPVSQLKEKDWIINKVSDSITPLPIAIKVNILSQSAAENLYILEVQPSPYKPHQFDNRYFVRLDGQTKPAPHYFVEALFRKITYPNIEGYLKFNSAGIVRNRHLYYVNLTIFLFNFSRLQNEENVIYRMMCAPGKIKSQLESKDPYDYRGNEPLLHFGNVMTNNQIIILTEKEINDNDFAVHIILSVGGKKSPAKSSDYTLNLRNINQLNPEDTSTLIASSNEDELLYDKQERLGTTRETTLRTALGRLPQRG